MLTKTKFGKLSNKRTVHLFTFENTCGTRMSVTDFGGIITSLSTPDCKGHFADIVLGYDTLEPYLQNPAYLGAIVGRCANRIGYGEFILDGKKYVLTKNLGMLQLHGGIQGFSKKLWEYELLSDKNTLRLTYFSIAGEEGYPGNLKVTIAYTLNENSLIIKYEAVTDKPTIVNLTNHSYFNLQGEGGGTVYNHLFRCDADMFTPLNEELVPTGEIKSVEDTPYDFRTFKEIGKCIKEIEPGYDINFVLNSEGNIHKLAARVEEPRSQRFLELYTTQPAVQFYSGNYLDNIQGKKGHIYKKHYAFCLETQAFPDAPHHPQFPSVVLRQGEQYAQTTIYRFGINGRNI